MGIEGLGGIPARRPVSQEFLQGGLVEPSPGGGDLEALVLQIEAGQDGEQQGVLADIQDHRVPLDDAVQLHRRPTPIGGPTFQEGAHVPVGEGLHPHDARHDLPQLPVAVAVFPAGDDDPVPVLAVLVPLAKPLDLGGYEPPPDAHLVQTVEDDDHPALPQGGGDKPVRAGEAIFREGRNNRLFHRPFLGGQLPQHDEDRDQSRQRLLAGGLPDDVDDQALHERGLAGTGTAQYDEAVGGGGVLEKIEIAFPGPGGDEPQGRVGRLQGDIETRTHGVVDAGQVGTPHMALVGTQGEGEGIVGGDPSIDEAVERLDGLDEYGIEDGLHELPGKGGDQGGDQGRDNDKR
uniref:Uncharacterized protein n=1 Tax=Candidatus Kentrum sp. FM TaxID=2126340 RepID=A0A450SU53_9GAMM|nr:MAG: hypothetical protein BECKFM1743C_GA0114222_102012 [Candidatus Kentron sp. FM]VFJ57798.1 MAG: hypothetical protein BECKFM1743A_GA0114220_102012 [Candidatus Kentron sp. FM]VFK11602.1 MAG: hypothetical protein BECKFM1743B_GA0114221_101972 [Candidatus Kentron sp. FM]